MNVHSNKTQKEKSQSVANDIANKSSAETPSIQFVDNRPSTVLQKKLQELADQKNSTMQMSSSHLASSQPLQLQKDLPDKTPVKVTLGTDLLYGHTTYLDKIPGRKIFKVLTTENKSGLISQPKVEENPYVRLKEGRGSPEIGSKVTYTSKEFGISCTGTVQQIITGEEIQKYFVMVTHDRGIELPDPYEEEFDEQQVVEYDGPKAKRGISAFAPGTATFTHYHKKTESSSSSEHIVPRKGKIEVTNHGLGAGIYGLQGQSPMEISRQEQQYKSKGEEVRMQNPLVLQHGKHGEEFTSMSKKLQEIAAAVNEVLIKGGENVNIRELDTPISMWLKKNEEKLSEVYVLLKRVLARVGIKEFPDIGIISRTVNSFLIDYITAEKYADQPINFLMTELGYDGVFADNPTDNAFNRGNVKYVPKMDPIKRTAHEERLKKKL